MLLLGTPSIGEIQIERCVLYLLIGAGGGGAGGKTIGGGTGGAGARFPEGERLMGGAPEPEYSGRGSCRYFIIMRSW